MDEETSIVNSAALVAFKDEFLGEIALPHNPGHDAARVVWNGMIDRRPAIVARWSEVLDVIRAVRFARDQDLGDDVVRGIYGAEKKYERLVELKCANDPDNVFRLNQRIRPR
jgi:FAD/FMN-containing dehydrogenase